MFSGPAKDAMAVFPTRAVALPDGRAAYSFTMFQGPGMPDELFDAQHASLQREFANIEGVQLKTAQTHQGRVARRAGVGAGRSLKPMRRALAAAAPLAALAGGYVLTVRG